MSARQRPKAFWIFTALIAVVIVAIGWQVYQTAKSILKPDEPPIDGIQCQRTEQDAFHIHSHLVLYVNGRSVAIPAGIGINELEQCNYWLHTHDDTGVIHVESPIKKNFTLGNFFDIWQQPLSSHQVWKYSSLAPIRAFVDGIRYNGNARSIVLRAHERIVLEVGPRFVAPTDTFVFPKGL